MSSALLIELSRKVDTLVKEVCGFEKNELFSLDSVCAPALSPMLTGSPVFTYLLGRLAPYGRICDHVTAEDIGVGSSSAPGIYYHQGVRRIYGNAPSKYRVAIYRQLTKLKKDGMVKTIRIKGKGFLFIPNYHKMLQGTNPARWHKTRRAKFYRLEEATKWIDTLENFEIGYRDLEAGYMKIEDAIRKAKAATEAGKEKRRARMQRKVKSISSVNSIIGDINEYNKEHGEDAVTWTNKLRGMMKNFIKIDHGGDAETALAEIVTVRDGWNRVRDRLRDRKIFVDFAFSFEEFYRFRKKIRDGVKEFGPIEEEELVGTKREDYSDWDGEIKVTVGW